MKHIYNGFTETGKVREINQDSLLMRSDGETGLFCVADGMGGHSHGEFASGTIIKCLDEWWDSYRGNECGSEFDRIIGTISQVIKQANSIIRSNTEPNTICGSTVNVLFVRENYYGVISAGDSRVYYKHKRNVMQITRDETWENASDNTMDSRAKQRNANFGKLLNAVGISDDVKLNTRTDYLYPGDAFLLCSDGIYKYCKEKILFKGMRKAGEKNLEKILGIYKDNVFSNGAKDNLTAIMVSFLK